MAKIESHDKSQAANVAASAIKLPEGSTGATKHRSLAKWWASVRRLLEAAEKKVTENFRVPPSGG